MPSSTAEPTRSIAVPGTAFRRIVVGIGDDGGSAAVALARALAAGDAAFMLTHIHVDPSRRAGGPAPTTREDTAHALDVLRAARTELALPCEIVVEEAHSASAGLHRIASREGADLLVVAVPGGQPQRGLHSVLHGAPCAVAIAPGEPEDRNVRFKRIGVGFRPTEPGRHALDVARALAGPRDAELHAMTAIPVVPNPWLGRAAGTLQGIAQLSGSLAEVAQEDLDAIAGIEGHVREGDPAHELGQFSRTVDLLVLGTRSGGPLLRMVSGSVTDAISAGASCPLLVVGCDDQPVSAA